MLAVITHVIVRVTRQPVGTVDGVALALYRPRQVYDVQASLAEYLIMQGFAIAEMRRAQRSRRARETDPAAKRLTTARKETCRNAPLF